MPNIDANNLFLYFNLLCGLILLIAILFGFINGLFKTTFMTSFFIVILIVGAIAIPLIAEGLLKMDISFANQYIPDLEVNITTLNASLPEILTHYLPEQAFLFEEGSESLLLAFGVVKMFLTIILWIILLILNFTLFKLIAWIIWLIIKPKKNKKAKKVNKKNQDNLEVVQVETDESAKKLRKPKKYRLWGGLVGAVRGLVLLLLLSIPISGISSFASSVTTLMELASSFEGDASNTESIDEMLASIVNRHSEASQFTNSESSEDFNILNEVLTFITGYNKTVLGKTYGFMDTKLFDSIFKVKTKVGDKKVNIKLRKEVENIVGVANIILEATQGMTEIDETILQNITDEKILEIGKRLSKIEIIKVATSIAMEYLYYEVLEPNNLLDGYEEELTLNSLKTINISNDFIILTEAIILIKDISFDGEIEEIILNLSKEQVSGFIDKLAELDILKNGLPIGLNFLLQLDEVQTLMTDYDIKPSDIVKPSSDELIDDFKNIGAVFSLFKDLDFSSIDELANFQDPEFIKNITDSQVKNIVDSIFAFKIFDKNTKLVSNLVYDLLITQLPAEFSAFLTLEALENNFNASEFTNLLLLAKILLEVDILSEDFDISNLLTDDNIEKIASRISDSALIDSLDKNFIITLIEQYELPFTIEIPANVTFYGQDGKTEITSLLTALKVIVNIGIFDDTFDPSLISNNNINDFATSISNSIIMSHNIPIIIESIDFGFDIVVPSTITFVGEAGKTEVISLLTAYRDVSLMGLLDDGFDPKTLTNDDISSLATSISNSKIMTHNIPIIIKQIDFEINISIPDDINFEGNEGYLEIKSLLTAYRDVSLLGLLDDTFDAKNPDIDDIIDSLALNISNSKIMAHNIPIIVEEIDFSISIEIPEDVTFMGSEGIIEISSLLKAYRDVSIMGLLDDNFDAKTLKDSDITSLATNISKSKIMAHNIPIIVKEIDFGISVEIPDEVNFEGDAGITEITSLLKAYRDVSVMGLLDDDFDAKTLKDSDITSLATNISKSKIMAHNIPIIVEEIDFGISIEIPDKVNFEGNAGITEISSLLKAYRDISVMGLLDDDFDAKTLKDSDINSLATNISKSKIMAHNIPIIIDEIDFGMNIDVLDDVSFKGDDGYLEIKSLLTAYRYVSIIGLLDDDFDAATMETEDIQSLAAAIASSKIMADNIPSIFETIQLGVKIEIPDDLNLRGNNTEIESLLTAYRDITKLGFLEDDFNAKTLDDDAIDDLSTAISNSKIMAHNLPKILETVNFDISIEIPNDISLYGPTGKLEIYSLLKTYQEISATGLLDDDFNANNLTDEKIESLSTSISNSRIMAHNIPAIFDTINFGMKIVIPDDVILTGSIGKFEISALLTTYRDVESIGLLDDGFDAGSLTDQEIDNLSSSMSSSKIIAHNLPELLKTIDFEIEIEIPEGIEFEGAPGKKELSAILTSYRNVTKYDLLNNAAGLTDDQIEELSTSLSNSKIMAHNIPKLIENIDFGMTVEVPEEIDFEGDPGKAELSALLTTYRDVELIGLLNDSFDAGSLTDQEIDNLSSSMSSSKIIAHNLPELLKTIDFEIEIEIPEGIEFEGEPGKKELSAILTSYRNVTKYDLLNNAAGLTDDQIEELSTSLSNSKIMAHNIPKLIENIDFGITVEVPEEIDFEGDPGKAELSALLTTYRDVELIGLLDDGFDAGSLTDQEIDNLSSSMSSSKIIAHNLPELLKTIDFEIEIEIPEGIEFEGAPGKKELSAILTSYRNVTKYDLLNNAAGLTDDQIEELSTSLSNSKIMAHNIPKLIENIDFGITVEVPEEIDFEGDTGKAELSALLTTYRDVESIGLLDDGFDAGSLTDQEIDNLSSSMSSSKIMAHNLPELLKTIDFEIEIEIPEGIEFEGAPGKKELSAILTSYRNVTKYDLLNNAAGLTDDQIEELSTSLSNSKIMAHNIPKLIENIDFGITVEVPEEIDFEGDPGKAELSALLTTYRDVELIGLLDDGFDAGSLTDQEIDNLSSSMSSSKIMAHNLPELLKTIDFEIEIEIPEGIEFEGAPGKKELSAILTSYRNVTKYDLLNNAAGLTDNQIEELSTSLSNSKIMAHNIPKLIENIDFGITVEVPEEIDFEGDPGKAELSALLTSYRDVNKIGLLNDDYDASSLKDTEIDELSTSMSNSKIMAHNIPKLIETIDFGITIEIPEDIDFKGEPGRVELNALLTSYRDINKIGLLNNDFNSSLLEDDDIDTLSTSISSSVIMTANIPTMIDTLSKETSFAFLNNPNVEVVWDKTELYYTLKTVKIFSSNNTSVTSINNLTDTEINVLSKSKYVSNTIGLAIEDMNEPGNTLDGKIIIPDGIIWHSTDSTTGELEYLLLGFKELVGTNDLADFNPNTDELLDTDMNIVFNSKILELTLVKKHIQPLIQTGALSTLLNDKRLDGTDYRWYRNNELYEGSDTIDFLNTIKGLKDVGIDFNNLQYDSFINAFADSSKPQQVNDLLLESEIFRNSFYKMFNVLLNEQGNLGLVIYSGNDLDYWGTPAKDENPIVRKELYFILDALTAGNELDSFDFLDLDQSTANQLKLSLNKIPKSETLTPLLDKIVNSSVLSVIDEYRTEVDTNTLNTEQWINEIDVLLDVIVQVNNGFTTEPSLDPELIAIYIIVKDLLDQTSPRHTILYTSEDWL